jgi:hypothetical protein
MIFNIKIHRDTNNDSVSEFAKLRKIFTYNNRSYDKEWRISALRFRKNSMRQKKNFSEDSYTLCLLVLHLTLLKSATFNTYYSFSQLLSFL